jgi:ribosomal RNA assembly protein
MPKAITPQSTTSTGTKSPKVKKSAPIDNSDDSDVTVKSFSDSDIVFKQSTATAVATSDDIFGHIRFEVRIPKIRLPMLIGTQGATKGRIESETGCKLNIDSQEGDVTVEGSDVVKGYVVRDIVKAIGRGFNPDVALQLLKSDNAFELIEIADFVKNKNAMDRIKGRVIGQGGKTRETIEKLMDVHVSVQGKTVGIIGEIGRVSTARQAIEMLLEGSQHAHVYKWLEGKRRTFTTTELSGGPDFGIKEEYKKYLKD